MELHRGMPKIWKINVNFQGVDEKWEISYWNGNTGTKLKNS